ncbi:MAG: PAS domain S-box protein [Piscinibacter sp.]|nr:PAS domain S-box protein [Piscinibacter sp.]
MHAPNAPEGGFDLYALPLGGVLEDALEAIVLVDDRQHIVALNPAAQQLFDCRTAEVLGEPLQRFVPARHAELHDAVARRFGPASEGRAATPAPRHRVQAHRADGTPFTAEVRLSSVELATATGPRPYVAALLRDLTAERNLDRDLRELQRRLRAVFELAPVALWIADNDRIVFANRAAAQLLGSEHTLLGESPYSLLRPDSHADLQRQVAGVLGGGAEVGRVHGRLQRADGEEREVEIALAALPDHGHTTVQMVVADVTRQRAEARALERSRQQLRQLSASVVEAREEERRRIARELHDELGQRLTALKMDLSSLTGADGATLGTRVPAMLSMLDETVASVRRIAGDLRPLMLDDLGLNAAIEWLASEASRRLGIRVDVALDDLGAVGERVAIALYRMVQEALTNVARHANATTARVELRRDGDAVRLAVSDDGVGYPAHALQREGRWGLLGMRERADMLGGRLEIDNTTGGGACVRVILPLNESAPTPPLGPTPEHEQWLTP